MSHIAICCQGGGSHTAFTGGALGTLLEHARTLADQVTLTGTSGGAICAAVAASSPSPRQALKALWDDIKAEGFTDAVLNTLTLLSTPWIGKVSPYQLPFDATTNLKAIIERHVKQPPQNCLVGACNVLTGEIGVFGRDVPVTTGQILASCSVPTLFRATEIAGSYYWDGLFSQNPPISPLFDLPEKPDEIWIIRTDPKARDSLPTTVEAIDDRARELSYSISLENELAAIQLINKLLDAADISGCGYKPVTVHTIALTRPLSAVSRFDRSAPFVDLLFQDGMTAAEEFLRSTHPSNL